MAAVLAAAGHGLALVHLGFVTQEFREGKLIQPFDVMASTGVNYYLVYPHTNRLPRKALMQVHCHHKSVLGIEDEEAVLKKLGVDFSTPYKGCCGMAGSFGFEASHYDISIQVGERVLLPAVRAADGRTAVVADGFSCREQIAQATPRRALHLSQLLRFAQTTEGRMPAEAEAMMVVDHASRTAACVPAYAAALLTGIGAALAIKGIAARRVGGDRLTADGSTRRSPS